MTTERQIEANRQNATHSTGPRSASGKGRSARNAVTHGVFAAGATPISRGPFEEDADELEGAIAEIAEALQPRDAIEWRQARQVASLYVRLDRLDVLEAHSLAGDASTPRLQELSMSAFAREMAGGLANSVHDAITGDAGPDDYRWDALAEFVNKVANTDKAAVTEICWKRKPPQDNDAWREVTFDLLKKLFGDFETAASWAWDLRGDMLGQAADATAERMEIAAHRALDGTLSKTIPMRSRLGRQLEQALNLYRSLRARDLETDDAIEERPDDV